MSESKAMSHAECYDEISALKERVKELTQESARQEDSIFQLVHDLEKSLERESWFVENYKQLAALLSQGAILAGPCDPGEQASDDV